MSEVAVPIGQPGKWLPESNPLPPVADCSVVTHSNVLMTPTTLTLEVATNSSEQGHKSSQQSVCNDHNFLKKLADDIKLDLQAKLSSACGDVLYCDISALETLCNDVLAEDENSNQLQRYKRNSEPPSSVQKIVIRFKMIGKQGSAKLKVSGLQIPNGGSLQINWPL